MLLVIYPVISMCLFAISACGLYRLAARASKDKERTTLQRALQLGMVCSLALHLLSMLVLTATAYSAEHYYKSEIPASRLTLHFGYACQYVFHSIGILCLNVGIFIVSGMDPLQAPNSMPEQSAVYAYTLLRAAGALFFHLEDSMELQTKVMFIETFLASESAIAALLFVVLSGKVGRMKGELEESFITERFFVEPVFDTAAGASILLACYFVLDSLLRVAAVVVSINPPSQPMAVTRDLVNILWGVGHALFIRAVVGFLFIDVQSDEDDLLHRVLLRLEALRRDGLRFFRFASPARAEAESSEV